MSIRISYNRNNDACIRFKNIDLQIRFVLHCLVLCRQKCYTSATCIKSYKFWSGLITLISDPLLATKTQQPATKSERTWANMTIKNTQTRQNALITLRLIYQIKDLGGENKKHPHGLTHWSIPRLLFVSAWQAKPIHQARCSTQFRIDSELVVRTSGVFVSITI